MRPGSMKSGSSSTRTTWYRSPTPNERSRSSNNRPLTSMMPGGLRTS
jgi:hypothetical protein